MAYNFINNMNIFTGFEEKQPFPDAKREDVWCESSWGLRQRRFRAAGL